MVILDIFLSVSWNILILSLLVRSEGVCVCVCVAVFSGDGERYLVF